MEESGEIMKPSTIYKKAAESIFAHKSYYSCVAICRVNNVTHMDEGPKPGELPVLDDYIDTFKPEFECRGEPWCFGDYEEESRENRIIALLLMAEIAKEN